VWSEKKQKTVRQTGYRGSKELARLQMKKLPKAPSIDPGECVLAVIAAIHARWNEEEYVFEKKRARNPFQCIRMLTPWTSALERETKSF